MNNKYKVLKKKTEKIEKMFEKAVEDLRNKKERNKTYRKRKDKAEKKNMEKELIRKTNEVKFEQHRRCKIVERERKKKQNCIGNKLRGRKKCKANGEMT